MSTRWVSRRGLGALMGAGAVAAAGGARAAETPTPAPRPKAPKTPFSTTEAYDAAKVPAYRGQHKEVYAYIDAHQAEHLENLRRWVRQRSISAQNDGVQEMARLVEADLKALGFQETAIVPSSGHPGVWGYLDQKARKTLVVYMMYDVQPIEPTGWSVDAFAGELVDDPKLGQVLMARGATNQKGPERAFLNAVASILAVKKKLPVNLMILAEGEEELGSPHYPELIAKYESRLKTADGVFFPMNSQTPAGQVTMPMGVKGIWYVELETRGGPQGGPKEAEVHGSHKSILDSPVWRLAHALASLTTPDGNTCLVPGFYDPIRPPNLEEQRLANGVLPQWLADEAARKDALKVDRWMGGMTAEETLYENLFNPSFNIDGLVSGYTGVGAKTILPHKAVAKVDVRMVPNQTPAQLMKQFRSYLDAQGFADVKITQLSGYPAAQTTVEAPLVKAAIGTFNKYGVTPTVLPRLAGSAPYYVFTDTLKLPLVTAGLGHGSRQHAPDEYMVIKPKPGSKVAGLAEAEKFYVDLLYALADA